MSRLSALAPLTDSDRGALRSAAAAPHHIPALRDLMVEGQRMDGPLLVLEGWLGRTKSFSDGRRQILGFFVPGDVIAGGHLLASSTITALCDAILCPAPAPDSTELAEAYAFSAALDEAHLLRQIGRLGRMSAYARTLDWLREMHERLSLAGLAGKDSFAMPLTQETLADALGLTSVHVNRTLQAMRRDGVVQWRGGTVQLKPDARDIAGATTPPRSAGMATTRGQPASFAVAGHH